MDKLLEELEIEYCSYCKYDNENFRNDNCGVCVDGNLFSKYEPNDTIKEIDRLIKLGRRYDTDIEINRVKERRWAKEVK